MILKNKVVLLSRFLSITAGVILILILPQINMSSYAQSTITSKFIIFGYAIICLIILCTANILLSKKTVFLLSRIDFVLAVLLGYITVNRYFIQSHYGFSIRFMELLTLSVFYFILRFHSLKYFLWLLPCIVFSGILQALQGYFQLLGFLPSNHLGFKITGSFFNPGPYAGFLVIVWIIALGMYLFNEKIVHQLQRLQGKTLAWAEHYLKYIFLYVPLFALWSISVLLFVLQSRASWIAAFLCGAIVMDLKFHFFRKLKKRLMGHYARIALLALSVLMALILSFAVYNHKKSSSQGRTLIWKISSEMILDSPFFGVGFDRFKAHYMTYQANYFKANHTIAESDLADNTYYAFNEFIQFTAENGSAGLVLLITLLYRVFCVSTLPALQWYGQIIKSALLGIVIFSFFSYPMQILPIKVMMYFLLAQLANLDCEKSAFLSSEDVLNKRLQNSFIVFLAAGSLVVITTGLIHLRELQGAFKNWNEAQKAYSEHDYGKAVQIYHEVYPFLYNEGDFLMNYAKALSLNKQNKEAIEIFQQAKRQLNTTIIQTGLGDAYKGEREYHKAVLAYQNAFDMIPSRFYPLYLKAKLYEQIGDHQKAADVAREILSKEVKIYSTAIGEMKTEMKKIVSKYDR